MARHKNYLVIPARLASNRLPGKVLLRHDGKSVLQRTYEAALKAQCVDEAGIATCDDQVAKCAESFGARVWRTSATASSGTERVLEVARTLDDCNIVINLQADEPMIDGSAIDLAVGLLQKHQDAGISTIVQPIRDLSQLHDPNCVKAVFDRDNRALYFSRSAIPYAANGQTALLNRPPAFWRHVGIYAFRRNMLLSLESLQPSRYEKLENLEQLRWLAAGHTILVGKSTSTSISINTWDDHQSFQAAVAENSTRSSTDDKQP